MSAEALMPDSEDVFELPEIYRHVKALSRARFETDEAAVVRDRVQQKLLFCHQFPGAAEAMTADDLTPLKAAVVEAAADRWGGADQLMVDLWGARGAAFALEALIEYCHLGDAGDESFVAASLHQHWDQASQLLGIVRSATDADYSEAVAAAERLRRNEPSGFTRALTSFLFPGRPDWFWEDLTAADKGLLPSAELLPSVTTAEQAAALGNQLLGSPEWRWGGNAGVELALVNAAGPDALPFLLAWCDSGHRCPLPGKEVPRPCPIHNRCLDLIARIPSDDAMTALVRWIDRDGVPERLQAAAARFPRRALRILAETEPTEEITRLLTMTVLARPAAARAEAGRLSRNAIDRVEAVIGVDTSAESADLPEILTAPPWRDKKRKRVKPIVVEGLTPPAGVKVAWLPGERERWLTAHGAGWEPEYGWESVWSQISDGTAGDLLATYFAAYAPEDLVRPQLDTWRPPLRLDTDRARTFVAKYEVLALPTVLPLARMSAARAQLLQPFVSPEIAAIMVDGLARLRTVRGHATAWLRRHPRDAVHCLVPTALSKPGKMRQNMVTAFRLLEADGVDVVSFAQAAYGEEAAGALKDMLADRGLDAYPRTLPEPPLWARATLLSEIRLKDGQAPLPLSAAQAVVEMLMFSKPDAPYPGLEIVKEVCDASSLAEFAWSVLESWEQSGASEKELWALRSLGLLGDQTTVTRLQPLTRDWYAQSRAEHVYEAFDALATIGGDRSLAALHSFANRAWTPRTRRKAQATFDDVAQSMDLTADQFADRIVPTLGLSDDGTLNLDYGRRRFAVSFDDVLRPVVTDETGAVLRALPKPGKRDDPDLSAAAYQRFATLKREAQDLAKRQAARLEQAMLQRRRWTPQEFAAYLVSHVLVGRIVRRLVWGVYGEDGALLGSFRIAEDLSFADVDDARYEVPQDALIGVVHPVDLAYATRRWSEVFSDYEILQPFDQLGRPPLALTDEELSGQLLVRGFISPDARLGTHAVGETRFGPMRFDHLASRGWQRGPIGADRLWSRLLRPVGAGRFVVVELEPGLEAGAAAQSSYQAITAVWLSASGESTAELTAERSDPFGTLDPVTASEILRDLTEVTAQ